MEPIAIATLAFIGTKVGETLVEKFTEAVLPKADALRQKIWDKLVNKYPDAEEDLQAAENGSQESLKEIAKYLDLVMGKDAEFADEVKKLAKEIEEETQEDTKSIVMNIFGGEGYQNNSQNYGGTTQNINKQTNNYYVPPTD